VPGSRGEAQASPRTFRERSPFPTSSLGRVTMPAGPIPKHTITEDRSPNLRSKNTHSQGDGKGGGGDMFDGKTGGRRAPRSRASRSPTRPSAGRSSTAAASPSRSDPGEAPPQPVRRDDAAGEPAAPPATAASFASNAKLTNGELRGFRSPLRVATLTLPAGPERRRPRLPDLPARRVALLLPARRRPGEPRAVARDRRQLPPLLLDRARPVAALRPPVADGDRRLLHARGGAADRWPPW
jgi:hypothetical protein